MATKRTMALRARTAAGISASMGSFRATDQARTRVRVSSGGGDRHADAWTRRVLRDVSRDLQRNAEHYNIFLNGAARILAAPTPRHTSSDEGWNKEADACWAEDAASTILDARNQSTWDELVHHWWLAGIRDGDLAILPQADGRIASVLADQIDSPSRPGNQYQQTVAGVKQTPTGEALAYWLCPRDRQGNVVLARAQEYPADQVIFVALGRLDGSYTRGVPLCAAGLDNAERIDALAEAEVISAEQASNLYGILERQMAAGQVAPPPPLADGALNATSPTAQTERDDIDWIDFPAGSYLDLPAGLKWNSHKVERPNLDVPEFMRAMLSLSCAIIGMPYGIIYADYADASWSVSRTLVAQTRDARDHWHSTIGIPMVEPIHPWWLGHRIRSRVLRPPRGMSLADASRHTWGWPDRPAWPEPIKEEQRHAEAMRNGTDSLHRICGPKWSEILKELAMEARTRDSLTVQRLIALQAEIAAAQSAGQLPADITWRDIASLSTVQPQPVPITATAPDSNPALPGPSIPALELQR